MKNLPPEMQTAVSRVVEGLGYELCGVLYRAGSRGGQGLLRVYIDQEQGISVDDCSRVSRQISAALDVLDPITGRYLLEVSSPGLDRPLFEAHQFMRFLGREIRIELWNPLDGRRRWRGELLGVQGEEIALRADGAEVRVALAGVREARLVPEYR